MLIHHTWIHVLTHSKTTSEPSLLFLYSGVWNWGWRKKIKKKKQKNRPRTVFFFVFQSRPPCAASSRGEREKEREPNEARGCSGMVSTTQKLIKLLKCLNVLQKKSIQNTATSVIIMNLHYPTIQIRLSYFWFRDCGMSPLLLSR